MNLETIYEHYDEAQRLKRNQATMVEYLTTMHMIERYAQPGCHIVELGAATGAYSLALAKQGYQVTAVEPLKKHLHILKAQITADMNIRPLLADACTLSMIADNSCDMVLSFGPLYHLDEQMQAVSIQEALRICRCGGYLFFAYLPHDMVITTETLLGNHFMQSEEIYTETMQLKQGSPFYFMNEEAIEAMLLAYPMEIITHFAADGLAELEAERLNKLSEEDFSLWMKFHLTTCEKPSFLGHSNHNVFVARKR